MAEKASTTLCILVANVHGLQMALPFLVRSPSLHPLNPTLTRPLADRVLHGLFVPQLAVRRPLEYDATMTTCDMAGQLVEIPTQCHELRTQLIHVCLVLLVCAQSPFVEALRG